MKNETLLPAAIMVLAAIIIGSLAIPEEEPKEEPIARAKFTKPELHITTPDPTYAFEVKENRQKAKATMDEMAELQQKIDSLEFPTIEMQLTSLGTYYITGYSPYECGGSWTTASGATCHRSSYEDRLTEPTTCAIDRSLHNFGDLFYIPAFDWVYVAEDTGSAVKGKHLDLFYPEYSDVVNFPTGYYEVYSVEYIYGTVKASNYDITQYTNKEFKIYD